MAVASRLGSLTGKFASKMIAEANHGLCIAENVSSRPDSEKQATSEYDRRSASLGSIRPTACRRRNPVRVDIDLPALTARITDGEDVVAPLQTVRRAQPVETGPPAYRPTGLLADGQTFRYAAFRNDQEVVFRSD